jgi:hypothetical protein
MTARNDVTGDLIASKVASDAYRDNYDAIFRKPKVVPAVVEEVQLEELTPEQIAQQLRNEQTKRWWAFCERHQSEPKGAATFEFFRDNILPTLGDDEYVDFLKPSGKR